jgi:hypothetical protein
MIARLSVRAQQLARLTFGRLNVPLREWACILPIMLLAAADRFVNLPARGIWDSDQGFEMNAIWNAVQSRQLPTFGSPAFTVGPSFHHGALFYDLIIPLSWASHGNPVAAVTEIAIFGLAVVPLLWWTARSIGGTSAGLATALLAAISPSFIANSTFIWNPVFVEPGAALACFGAWQAWKTGGPRWWVVAAAGTALASQSHLTGMTLIFPIAIFFLLALRRSPAGARRRMLAWGLAGVSLFLLTWSPWIISEVTHGFAETRAIMAFSQGSPPGADPFSRLFISTVRILAWPLTRWPLVGVASGFPMALAIAVGLILGLTWRVAGVLASSVPGDGAAGSGPAPTLERAGLLFICGSIALMTAILGLGITEISQFADSINQEQYHSVVDVFVVLAAGLVVGGVWRAVPLRGRAGSGHVVASVLLAALVVAGMANWPPLTAPDGGWPAAQTATARLERETPGNELAIIALPTFIPSDAYGYPLKLDGYELVAPAGAKTLVTLCNPSWAAKWSLGSCGGDAESAWMAANLPGETFTRVDTWVPAPDRVLSVYRRN